MPITFTLDDANRLLRFETAGEWDTAEMLAVTHAAYKSAARYSDYDILSDNRRNAVPATAEQVKSLAELMTREGAMFAGRRAAVIVESQASYGMIRMLAVRAAPMGMDLRAFWSMEDAMEFLRPSRRESIRPT